MTGAQLEEIFAEKIDKAYSNYLSPEQENNLLKEALYDVITNTYNKLSDQESYDEISTVIRTAQVFNLNNNKIYISPIPIARVLAGFPTVIITAIPHNLSIGENVLLAGVEGTIYGINGVWLATVTSNGTFTINADTTAGLIHTANTGQISQIIDLNNINKQVSDYYDLLALKAKFSQTLQLSITDATNTSPIRIKINKRNNLKTGEVINISGVNGNSNSNGDRYVKKINTYQYDLYSDKDLSNAVNGNGVFGGVGAINRIFYKSATPYFSSRQISEYSKPSISSPQFDRADNMIKILPSDSVCLELTLDYISTPPVEIDVANTTLDLENYFPYDFLIQVATQAATMFFLRSKILKAYREKF